MEELLQRLKIGKAAELVDSYQILQLSLRNDTNSQEMDICIQEMPKLVSIFKRDISMALNCSEDLLEIPRIALKCIGFFVFHQKLASALESELDNFILLIGDIILNSKDKISCNLAVWVISNIQFGEQALIRNLNLIQKCLCYAMNAPFESQSIQVEGIGALIHIIKMTKENVLQSLRLNYINKVEGLDWLALILKLCLNSAPNVRDKAEHALAKVLVIVVQTRTQILEPMAKNYFHKEYTGLFEELEKLDAADRFKIRFWSDLAIIFGTVIFQSEHFCKFLKIMEVNSSLTIEMFQFSGS